MAGYHIKPGSKFIHVRQPSWIEDGPQNQTIDHIGILLSDKLGLSP